MTLSDLQRHLPIANLFNCDFCTFLQQLTTFQLAQCVCGGPSEIAELLLRYNSVAFKSHSRLPLFYHIVSISTILFIFGSFGFRLHRTSIICWWYCTTGSCSCYGLQQLINICHKYGMQWDIRFNPQKSQLACFGVNSPRDNMITLGDVCLCWSVQIKYLGCCFRGKQCDVDPSSFIGRFCGTFNNILNVMLTVGMKCLHCIWCKRTAFLLCCIGVKLGVWVRVMRNVSMLRGTSSVLFSVPVDGK